MFNYVTRQTLIPARTENISCVARTLPPTTLHFIWPEYKAMFEAMTPNSSRDKHSWKSFEHYKRSVSPLVRISAVGAVGNHLDVFQDGHRYYDSAESSDPYAWPCNEFGSAGEPFQNLPLWYTPQDDRIVPDPEGLTGLKQRSLRTMLPLIKDELSLINSLIELKDFKSLPKTLKSIYSIKNLVPTVSNFLNGGTLRRLTRTAADGYLQSQFNIVPLLSDISGIYTALTKTKERVNALIRGQGYTQKRHSRLVLTVPTDSPVTQVYQGPSYSPVGDPLIPCRVASKATRYVYTDVSTFHAEIEYNYNFTQFQVEHAQLLGFLDALGVNLNPAIIWNAIPWSFVVDWVIGVSRWLNDRRILNMEPRINIHNYLWSWTARRRIVVYREISRDTIYHDIGANEFVSYPGVPMPVVTETLYKRVVEMPDTYSITSSGLSLKEFSLGAALVIVQDRRHKRSRAR